MLPPAAQESRSKSSLPLALVCASIVADHDSSWLARPVAQFQRLPLVGVRPPDGPVELLHCSYAGDRERQVLVQGLDQRRSLRDLAGDQLVSRLRMKLTTRWASSSDGMFFGEVFEVETACSRARESSRSDAA